MNKSGDIHNPEHYRGIAINPCVGKLFNIHVVLNTRLADHLTKRYILTYCQAGFRSKSRTTNHIFILKCLVDKYANSKGN